MGYGSYIKNNEVHEWSDFYVKYSKVSKTIKNASFKGRLSDEIVKIDNFYRLLESKAVEEKNKILKEINNEIPLKIYQELQKISITDINKSIPLESIPENEVVRTVGLNEMQDEDYTSMVDYMNESENDDKKHQLGAFQFITMPKSLSRRKKEKHITEFLHSLVKIKTYKDINSTAISKLVKKHKFATDNQENYIDQLKSSYFYNSKIIDQLKSNIKKVYKTIFAKNNPKKAKSVYRRLKDGFISSDMLYILFGYLTGLNSVCAYYIFPNKPFFALNNVFIGFICFGLCMKLFKSVKINYKFIFNFDYSSDMNNGRYMLSISLLNTTYIILNHIITWEYKQIALLGGYLFILGIPFNIFFPSSRIYLITSFGRGICFPISTIRFRHFYFVDVAQSFSFTILNLLESAGVTNKVIQNTVIGIFPFVRVLQCLKRYVNSRLLFPHVFNASKYLIAISSIVFKTLYQIEFYKTDKEGLVIRLCMIIFLILNTACSLTWDILVDFSIFRSRFMFNRFLYPIIVAYDIICRILWIGDFIIVDKEKKQTFGVLVSLAEIARRFAWTILRVEVEHLNNCNELKTNSVLNLTSGDLFYKKDQDISQKILLESSTDLTDATSDLSQNKKGMESSFDTTADE